VGKGALDGPHCSVIIIIIIIIIVVVVVVVVVIITIIKMYRLSDAVIENCCMHCTNVEVHSTFASLNNKK